MAWLLIIFESILLLGFTILDLVDSIRFLWLSSGLKYAGILLCVFFLTGRFLMIRWGKGSRESVQKTRYAFVPVRTDQLLLLSALCFTATADLLLLFFPRAYLVGVCLFIPVQIIYLIRILWAERIAFGRSLVFPAIFLRTAFFISSLLALSHMGISDGITRMAMFYFGNLLLNGLHSVILLWKMLRLSEAERKIPLRSVCLFTVGLLLFLGCDLSVGLWNLPKEIGEVPAALHMVNLIAMWAFYLPSQVCLTLSGTGEVICFGGKDPGHDDSRKTEK